MRYDAGVRSSGIFPAFPLVLLFFVSILFLPSISKAEDTVAVEARGAATAVSGDWASARDAAIADALRKAVEQVVGTMVSSDTATENFQLISDSVYTKSEGFIKSYSIVSEQRSADLVEVLVSAIVETGELKGDLVAMGLLQKKAGRPRVLFMVAEKGLGRLDYEYWWKEGGTTLPVSATEAALKSAFLAKGFNVVDITGNLEGVGVSGAFRPDITIEGARRTGKRLNAEVVIYGTSLMQEGPSSGATSVSAYISEITAQAVRVDDGALLASAKGRGTAKHIIRSTGESVAITAAAAMAADNLASQISAKWAGPRFINITLSGAPYEKTVEFKRLLRTKVRGITAIYQRRHQGDETSLEVESKEDSGSLADAISRLGGFRVTGFSSDTIEVEGAE